MSYFDEHFQVNMYELKRMLCDSLGHSIASMLKYIFLTLFICLLCFGFFFFGFSSLSFLNGGFVKLEGKLTEGIRRGVESGCMK